MLPIVMTASFCRETSCNTGSMQLNLKKYSLRVAEFGGAGADGRLAVAIDVLGAWARFTITAAGANVTSVACNALVGRV